jgi:hypothetical protein
MIFFIAWLIYVFWIFCFVITGLCIRRLSYSEDSYFHQFRCDQLGTGDYLLLVFLFFPLAPFCAIAFNYMIYQNGKPKECSKNSTLNPMVLDGISKFRKYKLGDNVLGFGENTAQYLRFLFSDIDESHASSRIRIFP